MSNPFGPVPTPVPFRQDPNFAATHIMPNSGATPPPMGGKVQQPNGMWDQIGEAFKHLGSAPTAVQQKVLQWLNEASGALQKQFYGGGVPGQAGSPQAAVQPQPIVGPTAPPQNLSQAYGTVAPKQ